MENFGLVWTNCGNVFYDTANQKLKIKLFLLKKKLSYIKQSKIAPENKQLYLWVKQNQYAAEQCNCSGSCSFVTCSNALQDLECPTTCSNKCENNELQSSKRSKVELFLGAHGFGLKSLVKLMGGECITEYVGEIQWSRPKGEYTAKLDTNVYICAETAGNEARFINSSCSPNAEMKKVLVNGIPRLKVIASRKIEIGDEILINYGAQYWKQKPCLCGSTNCCVKRMVKSSYLQPTVSVQKLTELHEFDKEIALSPSFPHLKLKQSIVNKIMTSNITGRRKAVSLFKEFYPFEITLEMVKKVKSDKDYKAKKSAIADFLKGTTRDAKCALRNFLNDKTRNNKDTIYRQERKNVCHICGKGGFQHQRGVMNHIKQEHRKRL